MLMQLNHRTHVSRVVCGVMLCAGMAAPRVVWAQGGSPDSVRLIVRAATPYEQQVESLARMLLFRQKQYLTLASTREALAVALTRSELPTGQRATFSTRLRVVDGELASLTSDRARIERQLAELCADSRKPEGWMGVAFSAQFDIDLLPNGSAITRFAEFPDVETVEPGSPAERSGILRGDRLVSIGGQELRNHSINMAALLRPGARLQVKLVRGVDTKTVILLVEPRPADFQVPCTWVDETMSSTSATGVGDIAVFRFQAGSGANAVVFTPGGPPSGVAAGGVRGRLSPSASGPASGGEQWLVGAQLMALNTDLGKALGVERGILVVDVARRSSAAQSGLRGGDVIVAADGRTVPSVGALKQAIDQATTRELKLQVIRLKKSESVTLRW